LATVLDVITAALGDLAVLEEGEVPNAAQSEQALAALNAWLDEQKLAPGSMFTVTRTLLTLAASDGSYDVGLTAGAGNLIIDRPANMAAIDRVNLVDTTPDPDLETPLHRQTEAEYQQTSQKALTSSYPSDWYYNPTYPLGTLILWPAPTLSTLKVAFYARAAVSEFAALELAPAYSKQPNALLLMQQSKAEAAVKRANFRPVEQTFGADVPGVGGSGYDIRQG
jgi:hypothetical protein